MEPPFKKVRHLSPLDSFPPSSISSCWGTADSRVKVVFAAGPPPSSCARVLPVVPKDMQPPFHYQLQQDFSAALPTMPPAMPSCNSNRSSVPVTYKLIPAFMIPASAARQLLASKAAFAMHPDHISSYIGSTVSKPSVQSPITMADYGPSDFHGTTVNGFGIEPFISHSADVGVHKMKAVTTESSQSDIENKTKPTNDVIDDGDKPRTSRTFHGKKASPCKKRKRRNSTRDLPVDNKRGLQGRTPAISDDESSVASSLVALSSSSYEEKNKVRNKNRII